MFNLRYDGNLIQISYIKSNWVSLSNIEKLLVDKNLAKNMNIIEMLVCILTLWVNS